MNSIDWNEIWKEVIGARTSGANSESSEFWDRFAPNFYRRKSKRGEDEYVEKFYELMQIRPEESIFDMGCASGTLAIPYAAKGHEIYAADFSSGMLDMLMKNAAEEGVEDRIHPIKLDWNEDWTKRDLPVCDISIASRSLIFRNLTESLKKLESVARRRVCLGAWDIPGRGFDRYLSKAIGCERPGLSVRDVIMGELMSRDLCPEMLLIETPFRLSRYESFEEGVAALKATFASGLSEQQEKLLEAYCGEHLVRKKAKGYISAGGDGQELEDFWQMDHSDMSTISFIRWDKRFVTTVK